MATGNATALPRSSTITCPIRDLRKYHHPSLSLLTNTLDHHLLQIYLSAFCTSFVLEHLVYVSSLNVRTALGYVAIL